MSSAVAERRQRAGDGVASKTLVYGVLVLAGLAIVIPFLYMASTSLKTLPESMEYPPSLLPEQPIWRNYLDIWNRVPLGQLFLNSVKVTGLSVLGSVVSCSMAGYAFARLRFPGRDALFIAVIATLMIPYQVTLVPMFLLFNEFGWINTHLPLIIPSWFGPAFGVFLMRQFFRAIPRELEEAARLDGCNPAGIFLRIFLPLTGPALAALVLFQFLASWNNLLLPLVFLQDPELMTLPVGLTWLTGRYFSDIPLMMTATTLSVAPAILLFAVLQKYFVRGVVMTGIKG